MTALLCQFNDVDRDAPQTSFKLPNGTAISLWNRGRRTLWAALKAMLPLGLADATEVMLTGDSAGG